MSQAPGLLALVDRGVRHVGTGLIVLGAVVAIAPLTSGLAVAVVIGLVLLAAGALIGLFGLRAREAGKGNLGLLVGALAALCGLVLVVQPSAGLAVVRWILIPYLLASGVSELALALRLRPEEGWSAALGGAAVSILAGLALWTDWPLSGARAIGLLVGVTLLSTGWAILRVHRSLAAAAGRLRAAARELAGRAHT